MEQGEEWITDQDEGQGASWGYGRGKEEIWSD